MGAQGFAGQLVALAPAGAAEVSRALPAQQGMIMNYLRFPQDGVDVIQVTLDWDGPLDPEPFEAAWRTVTRRNPILRTIFRLDDLAGLVQLADPAMSIDLRWRDLPPPAAHGPDHPFESFLLADRREQFDLTQGPVVRLTIVRRVATNGNSAGDCPASRAVLTFHHALLDGGSLRLLIDEVSAEYAANLDGRAEPDPVRPQFGEFVRWWYATDPAASEQFWTTYLAGTVLPQPLPGYLGAAGAGSAEPRTVHVVLSLADSELVRTAASDASAQAPWSALPGRCCAPAMAASATSSWR